MKCINPIPPILYKYKVVNIHSIAMLVNRTLYFPSPSELNDPYDCRIDIQEALEIAIDKAPSSIKTELIKFLKINKLLKKINDDAGATGIFSLTTCSTDMKMWTHYADNHKGFCLGFQFSERFLKCNAEERIIGTSPVHYTINNPFIEFFRAIGASGKKPKYDDFWVKLLNLSLIAKSAVWQEEDEYRITRAAPGFVPFDPSELREIIFGLGMESAARQTVMNILSAPGWQHVKYFEMKRDSSGYAIKRRDLSIHQDNFR